MTIQEETERLLNKKPEIESDLREILDIDSKGRWDFQDISLDSGVFGEIVSREIVRKTDDGYEVRDRQAVRAALEDDTTEPKSNFSTAEWVHNSLSQRSASIRPQLDALSIGGIFGSLLLVLLLRFISLPSVIRDGRIVLLGNDPYYYRYWVESLLTSDSANLSVLTEFPPAVANGEPLLIASLWLVSSLLGGTADAVGWTMALYPVLSAFLVAIFLALLAFSLSRDLRVVVSAVALLAFIRIHVLRSSFGYADHHAFDWIWLMLTFFVLVILLRRDQARPLNLLSLTILLGVGIAGQTLAWDAGLLFLVPLGVVVFAHSLSFGSRDISPLRAGLPFIGGTALGAFLIGIAHLALGWHTTVVATAPLILFAGVVIVYTTSELAYRNNVSPRHLGAIQSLFGMVILGGVYVAFPELGQGVSSGVNFLVNTQGIGETASLLSTNRGAIVAPLLIVGAVFPLALPYLGWATYKAFRDQAPQWQAVAIYSWYFIGLAVLQIRFVGELSPFIALLAGLGFVHLLAWVDVIEDNPNPDTHNSSKPAKGERQSYRQLLLPNLRTASLIAVVFLAVVALSLLQMGPMLMEVTFNDSQYQTAQWIAEDAESRNLGHPRNYVFTPWDVNRPYNYFVNGHSRSYSYAYTHYPNFTSTAAGQEWYQRLADRAGYIVIPSSRTNGPLTRDLVQLNTTNSSIPGIGHYRLVYASSDQSQLVFRPITGAVIKGNANAGSRLTLSSNVSVPGADFTYRRSIAVDQNGDFHVRVPYPGVYKIGNQTIKVSAEDVSSGNMIQI